MSPEPARRSAFSRFEPRLQEAIVARLGWTSLRPVQEEAGHAILDGLNAVVLAPTAGGKTEASMFPVLSGLISSPPQAVGALYIAPIKALLNNQEVRLGTYSEMVGLRRFLWHGDASSASKGQLLRDPAELLMTTPESLEVMLVSPRVQTEALFADLRYVVIDEVHALAGHDRGAHLLSVLERLARVSRHDIQRIGLSATVGNPEDILAWLRGTSQRAGMVVDPPKVKTPRELAVRYCPLRAELATRAASLAAGQKSLFFCESRALAEEVSDTMRGRGLDVFVHHSSVALEERQAAEARFAHGRNAVIVCTSTLELGIDVGDLDRVLQANAPSTVSSFLQRMGRTGRRPGSRANTVFFCESPELVLQAVALIELARRGWVESVPQQRRCWPVLVHQLLAMTLERGGSTPSAGEGWAQLSRVPDLAGITRAEHDEVLAFMVAEGYLHDTGRGLTMGDVAERVFGRKGFMELYAVFSSPQLYTVVTHGGQALGSLEQGFVDKLVEKVTCFLLGGRGWIADVILHSERKIVVSAAASGRKPTWGGRVPQLLGYDLCQTMAEVLRGDTPYAYLDKGAADALQQLRDELGGLLRGRRRASVLQDDERFLYTFAGGAVNLTLRYGLQALHGWTVSSDNLKLRFATSDLTHDDLEAALERLADPAVWEAPEMRARLLASLPEYRLSKFQRALPPRFATELVERYLLDLPTTLAYLSGS